MMNSDNEQNSFSVDDKLIVAWKALPEISQRFGFTVSEMLILLGNMPIESYRMGIAKFDLPMNDEQLERISYLLGIMKALQTLFSNERQAFSWIDRENSLEPFVGLTPKQFLLNGSLENLRMTRRMLDSWTI